MPEIFDNKHPHSKTKHMERFSPVYHKLIQESTTGAFRSFAVCPPDLKFETQETDEKIILFLRQHPIVNLGWILLAIGMLFLPTLWDFLPVTWLPARFQLMTIIGWYLLVLAFVLERFLGWYFNVYIVTDERIVDIDFEGLAYRNLSIAQLGHIEDVTFRQAGTMGAIFNYGDVFIQTAAEQREFDFGRVPQPARVVEILYMLQQEEQLEALEGRIK